SFAVGIENDPLCGGTRLLEWTGGAVTVTNRSGFRQTISNNWVCVAGRYGMAAGPSGYFSYQAPTTYNRSGAAEDTLQFMPADVLAPRYAVWFPGKTAAETASNASAVSWSVLGSAALLTFPGPGGMPQQMSIPLLANGTWSADISGNWSDTNNWSGGLVASGPGYTADLSALNLTADRTVTLDSSRSIGTLKLGESLGSQNWILNASRASVLTLDAGADIPAAIVVNQNTAAILAPLAGANGLIKSGPGALILGGANSLAGTLYVDSGSTVANDGALRIISSAALAGMDAISIRNSSAGASTFQLDGTAGDLVVAQNITAACRASSIPSLQNIAGRNVLAGNLYMQTGGSNVVAQSDSGTLVLAGSLQYIGNLAGGRAFNFYGAGDTVVSGSILAATNGAVIGVGKSGSGTLTLGGANTYTGPTALNAGTLLVNGSLANGPVTVGGGVLGGTGTLNGPVTVQAAGQLQPGSSGSLGTLTINNTLNLAGTTLLALNRTNRPNSSQVLGLSSLTCGGTLRVVNEGPALQIGDVFQLFAADRYLNGFDALVLPPLAPSLAWNTVNLMQNGALSVEQMPVITIPPGSQVVECSSNATFTVTAIGSSPLAYQWSLDGMPVPGATNASFTLNNVHGAGSAYGLSVQVINPYGSASASAALSVQDTLAPVLTLNGANPLFIERASAYNEPGATATDACAGPVPVTSNGLVNTAIVGTNTITYTAEDGSGHTS
ncbi:MAG TPA: immunoglobulin-like domain-containing protein, partial [Candidatus Sulfotelmatobacter sp.]|nr:immunoglobulin-like domain-containing protein [Candidatus Sulfotelmatobacter sp.]